MEENMGVIVKSPGVTEQVTEYLQKQIANGVWEPGEKISSENELTRELGVSRASIRSGIQQLVAIGVLDTHQGKGTFVRAIPARDISKDLGKLYKTNKDLHDLLEYCMILETECCRLAAERISEEELDRRLVRELLEELEFCIATESHVAGIVNAVTIPFIEVAEAFQTRVMTKDVRHPTVEVTGDTVIGFCRWMIQADGVRVIVVEHRTGIHFEDGIEAAVDDATRLVLVLVCPGCDADELEVIDAISKDCGMRVLRRHVVVSVDDILCNIVHVVASNSILAKTSGEFYIVFYWVNFPFLSICVSHQLKDRLNSVWVNGLYELNRMDHGFFSLENRAKDFAKCLHTHFAPNTYQTSKIFKALTEYGCIRLCNLILPLDFLP